MTRQQSRLITGCLMTATALLLAIAVSAAPVASTLNPTAGEQLNWQVLSSGGSSSTTPSYKLGSTIGESPSGMTGSGGYKLSLGFWQDFSAASCCTGKRGNVNSVGIVDLSDLTALVSYLTGGGYVLPCVDAANVNGAGIVDLSDLTALVSYLTGGGYVLLTCP